MERRKMGAVEERIAEPKLGTNEYFYWMAGIPNFDFAPILGIEALRRMKNSLNSNIEREGMMAHVVEGQATDLESRIAFSDKVIEALRTSITDKWIPIWTRRKTDRGGDDCPLCKLAYACSSCPIFQRSGGCNQSPYEEWIRLTKETPGGRVVNSAETEEAALNMVLYLFDLYIEAEKNHKAFLSKLRKTQEVDYNFKLKLRSLPELNTRTTAKRTIKRALGALGFDIRSLTYAYVENKKKVG